MHYSRPARALVRGLAAPLALGGLFGGLAAGVGPAAVASAAASAAACQVQGSPPPVSPPRDSQLHGVAVISSCDAWAVGLNDSQILTEHFDGSAWKVIPGPKDLAGNLLGVSAVSTSSVYAVGTLLKNNAQLPLILHWDGQAWTPQGIPGLTQNGFLRSVTAVSATDVWAAGDAFVPGTNRSEPLILHFDGSAWTRRPALPVGRPTNDIRTWAVSATSSHDAWVVGTVLNFFRQDQDLPFILHWNGSGWTRSGLPILGETGLPALTKGADLLGVAARTPDDAWAVGSAGPEPGQTLILHWNGLIWVPVPSPSPGGLAGDDFLRSVTATSPSSAVAVGQFTTPTGTRGLLLRWDGTRWHQAPIASSATFTTLLAVDADSPGDDWAVGFTENVGSPDKVFAVHGF